MGVVIKLRARLNHPKSLFILLVLISALPSLQVLLSGSIPFWYDPARDLLQALANLRKPNLIGPPAGIPGVYYGPYWIWLLSLASLISLNPVVITFLVLTLPYFVLMPLVLWRMRHVLGTKAVFLIWLAFAAIYDKYLAQLWNPHPAPLIFLTETFLVISYLKKPGVVLLILTGFSAGLLANFHMSFGVAVIAATAIYLLAQNWRRPWRLWPYFAGLILVFLPFLIFEARHSFSQIRALLTAFIYHVYLDPVVLAVHGLTPAERIREFAKIATDLFGLTPPVTAVILFLATLELAYRTGKHRLQFSDLQIKTVFYLLLCLASVVFVYLTAKNPVWNYHFIAVDLLVTVLLIILISRTLVWPVVLFVILLLTLGVRITTLYTAPRDLVSANFANRHAGVEEIFQDANGQSFSYVAYTWPLLQTNTLDYDYLFLLSSRARGLPLPQKGLSGDIIYLIANSSQDPKWGVQFINDRNREMEKTYQTAWDKHFAGDTRVVKKIRL